jgi:hypothetical protein
LEIVEQHVQELTAFIMMLRWNANKHAQTHCIRM